MKSLDEMTYDEMVDYCAWATAQAIVRGQPLREAVFMTAITVRAWHDKEAKKLKATRAANKKEKK